MLVTRPQPGADDTARRLVSLGWQPVLAPMLRIAPVTPAGWPDPASVQAVVVASGHAPACLPAAFHARPLLAVGAATAARAAAAGFADIRHADGDAADLAALCAAACHPHAGPVLLATAVGQGGHLAALLTASGLTVQRLEVYRAIPGTVLPPAALAAWHAGLHAALFLSAETARAFVAAIGPAYAAAASVEALAIGQPAAAALAPLPWRRVRVAVRPTQDAVLALLA